MLLSSILSGGSISSLISEYCSFGWFLADLGGAFSWGRWGLASSASHAENLLASGDLANLALLLLMPVEILLELLNGHLISSLGWLLATWGGVNWELLGTLGGRSLGGNLTLGRGILLSDLFGRCIFSDLFSSFLGFTSWFNWFLASSFLGLSSRLGGSLLLSLDTTLNFNLTGRFLLWSLGKSIFALLLDENVLKSKHGGVSLLEVEVVELLISLLASTTLGVENTLLVDSCLLWVSSGKLRNIWQWIVLCWLDQCSLNTEKYSWLIINSMDAM